MNRLSFPASVPATARFWPVVLLLVLAIVPCTAAAAIPTAPWFVDASADSGLDFHYRNGRQGKYWFPEIMGGGAGLLDFDGDGLLDVYLVQGGALGADIGPGQRRERDRLFRNVSRAGADGRLRLRFEDVTDASGIVATGYGMGVAVGDYDSDGDPDLYVLNYGANQLWRNDGGGRFSDVTSAAGVAGATDPGWSVSASFADLDGNGHLDLYVADYADFTFANHKQCRSHGTSAADYCSPSSYPGSADRLYRNKGDGSFADVSAAAGIASEHGHGLGVIAADLDGDGRTDLYVANDGDPNNFWINQGGMLFLDDAMLAGNAVNAAGAAEASMGVDAADADRDGDEDLFMTHMKRETNTFYANDGKGWFEDRSAAVGLAAPSVAFTGFGTAFLDIDNDGWLDLLVANGAVMQEQEQAAAGDAYPYRQRDQIFHNDGSGRFTEATARGGSAFEESLVGRGAAFGDLDNDGRTDVVIVNSEGPARVLLNRAATEHHWLGLRLLDARGHEQVGAIVRLHGSAPVQQRRSRRDGSYASTNDPRVLFGLATHSGAQSVEVRWPDGAAERFAGLAVDRYHELRKGSGTAASQSDTE